MRVVPGDIETDQQPPMTLPLRHFVIALGFLLGGLPLGIGAVGGIVGGQPIPAHVHLLVVGWICLTIMGAMTQFVPVWGGVALYSRRLATVQLWLVVFGVLGLVGGFLLGLSVMLPVAGVVLAVGIWTFGYNIARTLSRIDSHDITTRHFAVALGFFVIVPGFGVVLAVDLVWPITAGLGVTRGALIATHGTLAVFGAVLTTVIGALYQLVPMFTQAESGRVDVGLKRLAELLYPSGVCVLAIGRLSGLAVVARFGGGMVLVGLLAVSLFMLRQLLARRTGAGPLLRRYAVVVVALLVWSVPTSWWWIHAPLSSAGRFGAPGTAHLLLFGVIGFTVLGTLYHIVPFIVWVHRYSDQLGLTAVPMIEDLYSDRLARIDFTALLGGLVLVSLSALFPSAETLTAFGGVMALVGAGVFAYNLLTLISEHAPDSIGRLLVGGVKLDGGSTTGDPEMDDGQTRT